ncbi:energy-coupling factor ABC transporter permease [Streptomyces abyssomicinicus]|uniref:energy-coupling factor ABC transporter permease n=1 Tax=Streptomyces abyssomicinicus TaxID=574929 RepID=UPI00124FC204|nr:energy-coupling factor ABC transporter permease [Streptomyces abyssomicinicus]
MHVPDGFLDAPTSVATGVIAAGAVALSLRGARRELAGSAAAGPTAGAAGPGAERTAPLAGLTAAFIFAVQMLNFPVAAGTSGHLLGGALAAILVGPFTGVLCVSVVLLLQAIMFADGGLTALGTNITCMALVTVVVAHLVFRTLLRVLPAGRSTVTASAFVAALISVPASALFFTLLYAVGGTTDVPIGSVAAAMGGVHILIGIGEGVITALTVGAVIAVRPDLVHGARGLARPLKLKVGGELVDAPAAPAAAGPAPRSSRAVWFAGLAASLVLAGFVSFYASASPDGLEKVAVDHGIDRGAEEHAVADGPLADYGVSGVDDERLSVGLAGVIGVGVTAAVGTGVFLVVRRRESARSAQDEAAARESTAGHGKS